MTMRTAAGAMNEDIILLLTNKEDLTADFVVLELQKRGIPYYRFNTEDFPAKIMASIGFEGKTNVAYIEDARSYVDVRQIKSIWYRRPQRTVFAEDIGDFERFCSNESWFFLRGLWESIDCFWVSHPYSLERARSKIRQLKVAQGLGFQIPKTLISNKPEEVRGFFNHVNKSMVVKPVKSGIVRGENNEFVIHTSKVNEEHLLNLEDLRFAPSIFQEMLPKKYDIRVTVIGQNVFPVEIHSQDNPDAMIDWRKPQDVDLVHKSHHLPPLLADKCLKLTRYYGLQFAAIDLVLTPDNQYYFLEINPNGQWAWIQQKTGLPLTEKLVDLLAGVVKPGVRSE